VDGSHRKSPVDFRGDLCAILDKTDLRGFLHHGLGKSLKLMDLFRWRNYTGILGICREKMVASRDVPEYEGGVEGKFAGCAERVLRIFPTDKLGNRNDH